MSPPNLPMSSEQVLEREFLEIRAKILEVAASFDRLDRATGDVSSDPRVAQLVRALETVMEDEPHRAKRVQQIFSREYDGDWRSTFQI